MRAVNYFTRMAYLFVDTFFIQSDIVGMTNTAKRTMTPADKAATRQGWSKMDAAIYDAGGPSHWKQLRKRPNPTDELL